MGGCIFALFIMGFVFIGCAVEEAWQRQQAKWRK